MRSWRLSFEIEAVATITEVVKSAAAIASLSPAGVPSTPALPEDREQQQRDQHDRQDADARDRARRGADQARHVAAGGGDQEAEDEGERDPQRHQAPEGAGSQRRLGQAQEAGEDRDQPDEQEGPDQAEPADRHVALGARHRLRAVLAAPAHGGEARPRTPSTIGPSRPSSVHTAAMPIVPAPMKRTWWLQTSVAYLAIVASGGAVPAAVSSGHGDSPGDHDPDQHRDPGARCRPGSRPRGGPARSRCRRGTRPRRARTSR